MNYPYYQQPNYSQPNYYQQPTYYQPMAQNYSNALQQQLQGRIECAWVQGLEGAKAHAIAPNVTAFLMDSEDNILHIKSADNSGRMTMKSYDLIEKTNETPKSTDKVKYVKAEDFENLQSRFEKLESKFYNYKNKGNNNEKKEVENNG